MIVVSTCYDEGRGEREGLTSDVQRQNERIGQPHRRQSEHLGDSDMSGEGRVTERVHPIRRVVDGVVVVSGIRRLARVADVDGGDTEVLEEDGEVCGKGTSRRRRERNGMGTNHFQIREDRYGAPCRSIRGDAGRLPRTRRSRHTSSGGACDPLGRDR
jgi:hypothetical protein